MRIVPATRRVNKYGAGLRADLSWTSTVAVGHRDDARSGGTRRGGTSYCELVLRFFRQFPDTACLPYVKNGRITDLCPQVTAVLSENQSDERSVSGRILYQE